MYKVVFYKKDSEPFTHEKPNKNLKTKTVNSIEPKWTIYRNMLDSGFFVFKIEQITESDGDYAELNT